ncbi:MAG: hypothetical protein JWQ54_1057 [Mucilaginibacter sp.]|nr:hypothetical protein [Mucilaginibacter sp.]
MGAGEMECQSQQGLPATRQNQGRLMNTWIYWKIKSMMQLIERGRVVTSIAILDILCGDGQRK